MYCNVCHICPSSISSSGARNWTSDVVGESKGGSTKIHKIETAHQHTMSEVQVYDRSYANHRPQGVKWEEPAPSGENSMLTINKKNALHL
jgi:hypothetical protein